ncbi:MAG: phosphate transport system regulatory protein PhoU [Clostridiales bacterium]|nr:MAG: phosphate transport system regulatory protein PhoU [Clostridiales bacterium]
MRNRFDEQLDNLNNSLISMGALCETAIASTIKAMTSGDKTLAEEVIKTDREIDHKEKEIESLCLKLLLQQQPVARDLRLVSAALKMITDMERIGDQAADIAEIITVADLSELTNGEHITEMGKAVIKMVTDAVEAFVRHDVVSARAVIEYDDIVDSLFSSVRNDIIKSIAADLSLGEQTVDIIMIAKYLERIGDHAVNIAEWVVFAITGVHDEN